MAGLKALLSASLCISWLWTAHAEESKKKHPGEAGFWVQFALISCPEGKLSPAFQPDLFEYDLKISDSEITSVEISLQLMNDYYYPDEPPNISYTTTDFATPKELDYNPFQRISFDILTNETIGQLDKFVKVRIFDGKPVPGPLFTTSTTENTYKLRIFQGPEMDKIVVPTGVKVKDPAGTKLNYTENSKKFTLDAAKSDDDSQKTFEFLLPDENAQFVDVELECPDFPSVYIILNGEKETHHQVGVPLSIPMLGQFRKEVQIECVYEDDMWAEFPVTNAFNFIFAVHLKDRALLNAQLVTPAPYGHCDQDPHLDHPRWAGYEAQGEKSKDVTHGFICRVVGNSANFLSLPASEKVFSELVTLPDKTVNPLKRGVEETISTVTLRKFMTYSVRAGDMTRHYPVLLLRPANCTDLQIPEGKAYRYNEQDAETYMCFREECHMEKDLDHCFMSPPVKCTEYTRTCKADTKPHDPPEKFFCATGTCDTWLDDAACCQVPHPKGESVIHNGRRAVIYWADRVGVSVLGNIVYEDTCGTLDRLDLNEVEVQTCPTFINGEWVYVDGKHGTIVGDKPESGTSWLVDFFDTHKQKAHNCNEILKDAEWWLMCGPNAGMKHRPTAMQRIESKPVDTDIQVILAKDAKVLTTESQYTEVGAVCPAELEVTVNGAKGQIEFDCGGTVKCTIEMYTGERKSYYDHEFVTLREPPKVEPKDKSFVEHELVFLTGNLKARLAEDCSGEGTKKCKVIQDVDGSEQRVPLYTIVKYVNYTAGQQVFAGSKRGTVTQPCSTGEKCSVKIAGEEKNEEIEANELVLPIAAFRKGEVVFMNSRRGRIQDACGEKQTCKVKFDDSASIEGGLPAFWLVRRVPYHKGIKIQVMDPMEPDKGEIGTLTEVCYFVKTCKVKLPSEEHPVDIPVDHIWRLVGMHQGQEVVVDGRLAVTTQACNTCELCQLRFLDDLVAKPEYIEVPYSRIIQQNGLIFGTPVVVKGDKGWVRKRLPGNEVTVFLFAASKDLDAQVSSPTTDSEKKSKFIKSGEAPPWRVNTGSAGSIVRLVDPYVPRMVKPDLPLVVGDRVIVNGVDGMTALVAKRHADDDTYDIILQDTNTEMSGVGRSVLKGVDAYIMVGDSVLVDGSPGVVASVDPVDKKYKVRFNRNGKTSDPLPEDKISLNEEWRELGAQVSVKGRRGRIESLDMELGAYRVLWNSNAREISGPLKPWQLCGSGDYTGLGNRFAPGDEIRAFGDKGVVVAGPDEKDNYRVTLFENSATVFQPLLIDAQFLTPIDVIEGSGDDDVLNKQDRVMCVKGACKGTLGTVKTINAMGTAGVVFDGKGGLVDKLTSDLKKIGSELKTYHYGEIVKADSKSARIELGPDNLGNYMVRFDDDKTGGPYSPADFLKETIQRYTVEDIYQAGATTSSSDRLLQLSLVCSIASMALFLAAVVVHRRSRIISHRAISSVDGLLDE